MLCRPGTCATAARHCRRSFGNLDFRRLARLGELHHLCHDTPASPTRELTASAAYVYRVRTSNSARYSGYSNIATTIVFAGTLRRLPSEPGRRADSTNVFLENRLLATTGWRMDL